MDFLFSDLRFCTSCSQVCISEFKTKRLKHLDPGELLTREQHQNLWENNIELRVDSVRLKATEKAGGKFETTISLKAGDRVRLDRFGMGATALVSETLPSLCAEVTELVSEEVVGVGLDSATLESALIKIKKSVDEKWARSKQSDYRTWSLELSLLIISPSFEKSLNVGC